MQPWRGTDYNYFAQINRMVFLGHLQGITTWTTISGIVSDMIIEQTAYIVEVSWTLDIKLRLPTVVIPQRLSLDCKLTKETCLSMIYMEHLNLRAST